MTYSLNFPQGNAREIIAAPCSLYLEGILHTGRTEQGSVFLLLWNIAQKEMFSNRITNSTHFLQMPTESHLFYFQMVLRADDGGVVGSYPVIKLLGIAPDSFKRGTAAGRVVGKGSGGPGAINCYSHYSKQRSEPMSESHVRPMKVVVAPLEGHDRGVVKQRQRHGAHPVDVVQCGAWP